jgi:arylformamidase
MDAQSGRIIDISIALTPDTVAYPGDPLPEYGLLQSVQKGGDSNTGFIRHGLHSGTHVDAPYHFFEEGRKLDEVPL